MIESKLTLLDKQVEVLFGDSIVFSEHPFCLAPEVFNAVDVVVFLLGEVRRVIDTMMVESRHIKRIITAIAIGVDNTVRRYFP